MSASTAASTSASGVTFNGSVAFSGSVTFSGSVPFSHCPVRGFPSRYSRRRGASAPAVSRPGKPPRLRLTRRGRIVLIGLPLVLLAAVILSLAGLLNSPAKAADSAAGGLTRHAHGFGHGAARRIAVGHCRTVDPSRDPRDVIADIVQLNDLQAGKVMPGQQLFVPTK